MNNRGQLIYRACTNRHARVIKDLIEENIACVLAKSRVYQLLRSTTQVPGHARGWPTTSPSRYSSKFHMKKKQAGKKGSVRKQLRIQVDRGYSGEEVGLVKKEKLSSQFGGGGGGRREGPGLGIQNWGKISSNPSPPPPPPYTSFF